MDHYHERNTAGKNLAYLIDNPVPGTLEIFFIALTLWQLFSLLNDLKIIISNPYLKFLHATIKLKKEKLTLNQMSQIPSRIYKEKQSWIEN